jgi:hypothetical protein
MASYNALLSFLIAGLGALGLSRIAAPLALRQGNAA